MFAVGPSACEERKADSSSSPGSPDANASTDKYATADPKLAKALQATTSKSAASDNAPPPDGIFPPGGADQRHPKGQPTKVDLVSDGSEPKVALQSDSARASSYGPVSLELMMQMGPRTALPIVDFGLLLGPAKRDEGGGDWLVADVKKSIPAKQQLGQLPPGAEKEIGSLAGTSLRVQWTADGRANGVETRLAKSANPDLERLAAAAIEALVFATVPLPAKPVGAGALWIAETRMQLSGADVIAYRAYRVKDVDGDRLHLSLDIKAYAADTDIQLAGVPKGATLEQFDVQAGGDIELMRGEALARKSATQERIVMVFQGPGATQAPSPAGPLPGNVLTAQLQSQAKLVRGDDMRAASKQP